MTTSSDHLRLLQTVLDAPDPRRLAEFYRELLGFRYRPGDEPDQAGPDPDWLVLLGDDGSRRLAFQLAPDMPAPRWPEGSPPQMLHLDLTVGSVADLERQRSRAVALGAEVLLDRTADEDEPLYVLRDPAGHPFCVFVAPEPSGAAPA
ncbi:catechol 2,3-dioxygenase-like lactoylglutathione lyase family enzyme [Clavibacter michiganensis]|nr:catechol 2,3-dioxygenase-like lactoylglutathione lyase family enzyme [Clavibacter michiganensis]